MKWQVDEIANWWNHKLIKKQAGKDTSWQIDKLAIRQVLCYWKLVKLKVDETACWPNGEST